MNRLLTEYATSISDFKKNPNEVLRESDGQPFAVLTNNKPSFYVITPELYEELAELLWELEITPVVNKRRQELHKAIKVSLDEL